MAIDSKLAVAIAPIIVLIVHALRMSFPINTKYLPILCLAVSILVLAVYVISQGGFVLSSLYDYLVGAVVAASVASGLYSWGQTIQPNPPPASPVQTDLKIIT
jgi:hypothetical protein